MAIRDERAVEARALLQLPSLDGLTEQQVRGTACVWDAVPLLGITAVNLGPRTKKRLGQQYQWSPQACPRCVREAAIRALREHHGMCEQCTDDAAVCDIRAALERLAREGR
ncbi:hypothetical protein [Streptomyces sp. ME18-1-4]|uniref:hypothetical protein n=1 Tax=Streptomyces sp. ME18-1-4 TaxID=3028685 RepID=UPI0029AB8D8F|nr:hypothetical protein [Streptomyces sp. ME18-1-4]MDX3243684.1 hypothetical protein [Streptomyces sp. ME18-1-4]